MRALPSLLPSSHRSHGSARAAFRRLALLALAVGDYADAHALPSVDLAHNPIVQEYILPDLSAQRGGRVRAPGEPPIDGAQILRMGSERFAVPELLFRPDDVGASVLLPARWGFYMIFVLV